jgi:hypothetical protein
MDMHGELKDFLQQRKDIISVLSAFGLVGIAPGISRSGPPDYLSVLLDGRVVGLIDSGRVVSLVLQLRRLKVMKGSLVSSPLILWKCDQLCWHPIEKTKELM